MTLCQQKDSGGAVASLTCILPCITECATKLMSKLQMAGNSVSQL